jgi:hypothetical protein
VLSSAPYRPHNRYYAVADVGLLWCWRQGRRATEPSPRQHRPTYVADGAHEAPQEDASVAAELRVLATLYEAGRRELRRSRVAWLHIAMNESLVLR